MPRRNNRESLESRLKKIIPRGKMHPEEIPGTFEWFALQKRNNVRSVYNEEVHRQGFFENMDTEEMHKFSKNLPHDLPLMIWKKNETLIDNINNWVDGNGWQYIDGGEFHGSWVNPRYPECIFQGAIKTYPVSGGVMENVEFPISSSDEDSQGLACHFETDSNTLQTYIVLNKWISYDTIRRGRRQSTYNKLCDKYRKRWEQFQEIEQIKNLEQRANARTILKSNMCQEDINIDYFENDI